MLREHPELAQQLLDRALGLSLGSNLVAHAVSENVSDIEPAEYRADAVIQLCEPGTTRPSWGLVFEVQLRPDPAKRLTWPVYQTALRRRLQCPVILIAVAPDPNVARWCAQPIDIDGIGGSVTQPLVVGPANVPIVTSADEARQAPELAVLSVIAHGNGRNGPAVGIAAITGLASLDDDRASLYTDVVYLHLSEPARAALKANMDLSKYEYQSVFARKFFAEGEAEGKAEGKAEGEARGAARATIRLLEQRGLVVSDEVRSTLLCTRNLDQLQAWCDVPV